MERSMAKSIEDFVEQRFGSQQTVTKHQLVRMVDDSNMPMEMKDAIEGLPEGEWTVYDFVGMVRDRAKVAERE